MKEKIEDDKIDEKKTKMKLRRKKSVQETFYFLKKDKSFNRSHAPWK